MPALASANRASRNASERGAYSDVKSTAPFSSRIDVPARPGRQEVDAHEIGTDRARRLEREPRGRR